MGDKNFIAYPINNHMTNEDLDPVVDSRTNFVSLARLLGNIRDRDAREKFHATNRNLSKQASHLKLVARGWERRGQANSCRGCQFFYDESRDKDISSRITCQQNSMRQSKTSSQSLIPAQIPFSLFRLLDNDRDCATGEKSLRLPRLPRLLVETCRNQRLI